MGMPWVKIYVSILDDINLDPGHSHDYFPISSLASSIHLLISASNSSASSCQNFSSTISRHNPQGKKSPPPAIRSNAPHVTRHLTPPPPERGGLSYLDDYHPSISRNFFRYPTTNLRDWHRNPMPPSAAQSLPGNNLRPCHSYGILPCHSSHPSTRRAFLPPSTIIGA